MNPGRSTNCFLIACVFLTGSFVSSESLGELTEEDLMFMECGSLENGYGPYDYTNPEHVRDKLPVVEAYHFNANVESLREAMSGEWLGADLDYTLRAFPNHHRALYSMATFALRFGENTEAPGANWPGICYFKRAVQFKPDDATVRVIFGIYLAKRQDMKRAVEQLEEAVTLSPEYAEAHYNLGLVYEKLGHDDLAVEHAEIAYELGYPLSGLKNILMRRGLWKALESSSGDQ